MRRIQFMYDMHVEVINEKKMELRKVIRSAEATLDYCRNELNKFSDIDTDHIIGIKDLLAKSLTDNLAFVSFKGISESHFKTTEANNVKIKHYIRLYMITRKRLIQFKTLLGKLDLAIPPDGVFMEAVYTFNYNMIKEVLMGARFRLGHKVGAITVIEKERTTFLDGTAITKNINWNQSFINKQKLLDGGKTPYSKIIAPHGEKWFVYHDEPYTYWYKWTSSIFNKLMIGLVFKPLAYVTVSKKERAVIENNVKSVKDILNLTVFGPVEKLQLIRRKFPNHLLIFRKYA